MRPTRVLVADPVPIFRAGVRRLLDRERDFDVIEACSLADVQRLTEWPDLALVDVDLPPGGALQAVALLSERSACESIVWGSDPSQDDLLAAVRSGARGYLSKEVTGQGLVRALRGAVHGEAQLSRAFTTLIIDALHGVEARDRARARIALLSARECEVLDLISTGAATRSIASALEISEFTVKRHVQNILHKLGLDTRAAAAAFYRQVADSGPDVVAARLA